MFRVIILFIASITFVKATHAQSRADTIKLKMKKLQSFIGIWEANTTFHLRDGKTNDEIGTYTISWALDSTYQQWNLELENETSQKKRYLMMLVTYNTDSSRYEVNYFYNGSPTRIFETGTVTDRSEFLTSAFLPLSDGKQIERIRTVTRMTSANTMEYELFSRLGHEQAERRDFEARLRKLSY
ncbi:MAG TPA: DUF1579 family protein [Chitinophagaceae bacterium]|nr:DUF1579 family protein [Chitinophagaceae bacterium]